MIGKKLTDDVSIQELQQMRADGLTNKQIAERLGASYITILKYLGPQPDGLKANYGAYTARVTDKEPEQAPKKDREISLMEQYRKTVYAGEDFSYTVISTGAVKIEKRGGSPISGIPYLELTADQIGSLVKELMDIVWILKEGQ